MSSRFLIWRRRPRASGRQGVDVFVEVAAGQFGEQVDEVGVWFDAVHPAGSDQAGKPGPTSCPGIVTGKKRIAARHGRTSDRVLDEIGIHVDMAILQKQTKALLAADHVGQRLAQIGFARDTVGLRSQPGEEFVNQWA